MPWARFKSIYCHSRAFCVWPLTAAALAATDRPSQRIKGRPVPIIVRCSSLGDGGALKAIQPRKKHHNNEFPKLGGFGRLDERDLRYILDPKAVHGQTSPDSL